MATITISRQFGSGGRKIAGLVSELLGYRFFDKWLIVRVAADVGLSETDIVHFSEESPKVKSFMARLSELFSAWSDEVTDTATQAGSRGDGATLSVTQLDEKVAVTLVNMAILTAYKLGNVVIVGRGGQVVLKDKPGVLHVRIEAPTEARLTRLHQLEGLSCEEARRLIVERDRAAARYLERCHRIPWDNSLLYHLVINTGRWDLEQAAQLIIEALRHLHSVPVVSGS